MPAHLAEARKNLDNPPKIYTEIAIEQIDGNVSFFKNDVTAAFKSVTDPALPTEFKQANDARHRRFRGRTRLGCKTTCSASRTATSPSAPTRIARTLAADEMVDLPLDDCFAIADRGSPEEPSGVRRKPPSASMPKRSPTRRWQRVAAGPSAGGQSCSRRRRTSSTRSAAS